MPLEQNITRTPHENSNVAKRFLGKISNSERSHDNFSRRVLVVAL